MKVAYFFKNSDLTWKVVAIMSYPENNIEKSTLLKWLQRFGGRFEMGFIVTDPSIDNKIVFVNNKFAEMTGYSNDEVFDKDLSFLQGKETDMGMIGFIDNELLAGRAMNVELLNYKKDGVSFWNELVIQPILDDRGKVIFILSFIIDITNRKKDELLLEFQKEIFMGINEGANIDELMKNICDVVEETLPIDAACSVLFKNDNDKWTIQAQKTIPEQVIIRMRNIVEQHPNSMQKKSLIVNNLESVKDHNFKTTWSLAMNNKDGNLIGMIIIFLKIEGYPSDTMLRFLKKLTPVIQLTKTFYEQQQTNRWLAFTDPETGLQNHNAFLKELDKNIGIGTDYFVATIQPYEYDKIIDLYGRNAAAELFIELAKRIKKASNNKAIFIGRSSSSSLVLTTEIKDDRDGEYFIVQLKRIVIEPFVVAGKEMFITLKTGVSISKGEGFSALEMHRRSDIALTFAKRRPGNAVSFYRDVLENEAAHEMLIFNELTKALAADEIEVYFQPKVNLKTRKIVGFEALARWHSKVLGQVPPDVFIPVAETTGKIIELETSVLIKVIKWQRDQANLGKKILQVAVNISVDHFFDEKFIDLLNELVTKYEVDPQCIRLEITESIGLVDFERAKVIFKELYDLGFEMSIDDFGVGFSSLSYLPQLKVNELKIDRSFIIAINEKETRAVVRTIIQLADNLNMTVVAEGVETEEQIALLRSFGCTVGQGFYFYKPMSLHEIKDLLESTS